MEVASEVGPWPACGGKTGWMTKQVSGRWAWLAAAGRGRAELRSSCVAAGRGPCAQLAVYQYMVHVHGLAHEARTGERRQPGGGPEATG
ncbi:hypothetical protein UVI_02060410 [Ustilaginoidea virens]|uniref:Uncharacterized protein n=1 Tax=Ustilaginoidea virens TaxID=1159556 RepID=A0A1B5L6M6_USTVR|nr:hypothetical protein UVI_02060410 [Ustilaginoidea virens]